MCTSLESSLQTQLEDNVQLCQQNEGLKMEVEVGDAKLAMTQKLLTGLQKEKDDLSSTLQIQLHQNLALGQQCTDLEKLRDCAVRDAEQLEMALELHKKQGLELVQEKRGVAELTENLRRQLEDWQRCGAQ